MRDRDPNLVKYEKRAIYAVFGLFLGFVLLTLVIGGDAMNGRAEDGMYYVSSRGHETAVSGLAYYLSLIMGIFALGGIVVVLIYKIIMNLYHRR